MELDFVHNQNFGDHGDCPMLLHRPDNQAMLIYHTNDDLYYKTGHTPESFWDDVTLDDETLFEKCAMDREFLALAYEPGYNGIFLWCSVSWGKEPLRHELALLLERNRPAPRWLEAIVQTEDIVQTQVQDKDEIEVEGTVQE